MEKDDLFNSWVLAIIKTSEHPFVKSAEEMVNSFFELDQKVPDKYGWRHYDVDAFKKLIEDTHGVPDKINKTYWLDVVRSMEAYAAMNFIRTNEVLRSAIRSLNNKEIVPAAILSRSCLELASSMLDNANLFDRTVASFPKDRKDLVVVADEKFEIMLNKTIWGTRYGKNLPEHLMQKNILTIIQKMSKNPNANELLSKYEFLCELAHPNVIGNARFWSDESYANLDGSITIVIQKKGYSDSKKEIIENVLWALGWSAACVKNGFYLIQAAILNIDKHFDLSLNKKT
jgi:hypothetical protein